MADYGAEVIKIERPGTGDVSRAMAPYAGDDPHPEKSLTFLYLNYGKRSVTLDLKSPQGREVLLDLVRESDVLVENFEPRVMPSLGLDYRTLAAVNPKLVVTSISNFGQTGPRQIDFWPIDDALKIRLRLYCGLRRQDAVDFLRAHPLTISRSECEEIDAAVQAEQASRIAKAYDEASGVKFAQLPDRALIGLGWHNLGAAQVMVKVARKR